MNDTVNLNIPAAWTSYVTQTGLGLEVRPGILYDTQTFDHDAPVTQLDFFQQGNVPLNISNVKGGKLDNPESFLIQNISIYYQAVLDENALPGSAGEAPSMIDDIINFVNQGILTLTIGRKNYGPWPLWRLPASTFVKGMLAAAGAAGTNPTGFFINYGQVDGPLYALFPNLMLAPLQPFIASILFPSGPPTTTFDVIPEVIFDGQLATSIN